MRHVSVLFLALFATALVGRAIADPVAEDAATTDANAGAVDAVAERPDGVDTEDVSDPVGEDAAAAAAGNETAAVGDGTAVQSANETVEENDLPVQAGPLIDLLGPTLLSLQMTGQDTAQLKQELTSEALANKKVIGLYFSADWCGPCRQFTPELVKFYEKVNNRRGMKDQFEIVWVSRCRDVASFAQYFTHMKWLALPPEEAMGQRGELLARKYKMKGIPHLVLLDDLGHLITTDARNKIPQDRGGIGFPWRSPLSTLVSILLPRPIRFIIKNQIDGFKSKILSKIGSKFRHA